jgi:hypothetical protein
MSSIKIVEEFYETKKDLVLLKKGSKIPIKAGWPEIKESLTSALAHDGNLGWRIDDNSIVIDVDPRNGGDVSFKKLQKDLNVVFTPTVFTPRDGVHIYLKLPNEWQSQKLRKQLPVYAGIDFLTKGMQCVIPSSITSDGEYRYADEFIGMNQEVCPDSLLKMLKYNDQETIVDSENSFDAFSKLLNGNQASVSIETVKNLLKKLDPSCDYDSWLRVGMALKSWNSDRMGLELWDNWSQGCNEKYKAHECEKKWKGFDVNGGVTLGTLHYMAQEVDYDEETKITNSFLERIKNADLKQLEFNLPLEIRKARLSNINREKIISLFHSHNKKLTGTKVPIQRIRDILTPKESKQNSNDVDTEWCKDWVYVTSVGKFYSMQTFTPHTDKSFNVQCGQLVPASEGGYKVSATKFVSDWGYLECADTLAYLPNIKERFCFIGNRKTLNIFNPSSLPHTAEAYSDEGQAAIQCIKDHIQYLFGTKERSKIFEQWLAHQVQHTGQLLKWAPMIQSIQGMGKSFFTKLLRGVLGDINVGVVMPTQVMSNFNGWAIGRAVNVLEELRMLGHNRHDAANALKSLITDEMIQINDKGVSQFSTYNTANYICFTNFQDALPLEAHDRRWWIIFAPFATQADFVELVREPLDDYFERLHLALELHASEVRKWLLEYPISEEFKRITRAPMTEEKEAMIMIEDENIKGLLEAKAAIESGTAYYDSNVVSSSELFTSIAFECSAYSLQPRQKHVIIQKLGYRPVSKIIKIEGKNHRIWVKEPMTNEEIRRYIQRKLEQQGRQK